MEPGGDKGLRGDTRTEGHNPHFPIFFIPTDPLLPHPHVLEGVTPDQTPDPFFGGASPKDKNYQNLFYFYPDFNVILCISI